MQRINIQVISLNKNTAFWYIFFPFPKKLNSSIRKTLKSRCSIDNFFKLIEVVFCIKKDKCYLARIASYHIALKVPVERQMNFSWEKWCWWTYAANQSINLNNVLVTRLREEATWTMTNYDKLVYPEDKFMVIKLQTLRKMALIIATSYQAALLSVYSLYGDVYTEV